jgi:hypothetical protein
MEVDACTLEDNIGELEMTTTEDYKSLLERTEGVESTTELTKQAELTVAEPAEQAKPAVQTERPKHNPNENLDLNKAGERILEHYNGRFKDVRFTTPAQVVDGCVVEFADKDLNVNLATARLRFHNQLNIDQSTGNLFVIASLSDLTFGGKPHIDMRLR